MTGGAFVADAVIDSVKPSSPQPGCASAESSIVTVDPAGISGTLTFRGFTDSTIASSDDTASEGSPM